jgi:hypothetical protein
MATRIMKQSQQQHDQIFLSCIQWYELVTNGVFVGNLGSSVWTGEVQS